MIKVLVVDDSTVVRKLLICILEKHPELIVLSASSGEEALQIIRDENPDVVTLDVEMPVMNGLETLEKIMQSYPRPVIMLSALTSKGAWETTESLKRGAVDCIPKLNADTIFIRYIETELLARILYFGKRENYILYSNSSFNYEQQPQYPLIKENLNKLILIGASTGGPLVLQHILSRVPSHCTNTFIIALHMPKDFSPPFVERLQSMCNLPVKLIENATELEAKTMYVCHGGHQTLIEHTSGSYRFKVYEDIGEYSYKPSIDLLFMCVAGMESLQDKTIALILTGMGNDGLRGSQALNDKGVPIYAQDQESAVVFGMPKAVLQEGIAQETSLEEMPSLISTL